MFCKTLAFSAHGEQEFLVEMVLKNLKHTCKGSAKKKGEGDSYYK